MASLVEDKVQSSLFMTPFRSPEVQQLTGGAFVTTLSATAPQGFQLHW